jgi:hypothetical protein
MSRRVKSQESGIKKPEGEVKAERLKAKGDVETEENHSALNTPHSEINTSEIEHSKSEITNMEVHHHPDLHHERKPWKEYVLEGVMIFLAVTMGFFAENLREKITDNEKIHEYVQSMSRDLESDITLYRSSVNYNQHSAQMIDTIITSLTANKNNKSKVYFMARVLTMGSSVIAPNEKTFEQMKSSGTMRLVSDQRIADSIASYYQWVKTFNYWSEMQRQRINDLCNANDKIFDAAAFYTIVKQMRDPKKSFTDMPSGLKLTSSDPVLINAVIMRYQYYYGMLSIMNQHASKASLQATQLIKLLKKEYNLEDE